MAPPRNRHCWKPRTSRPAPKFWSRSPRSSWRNRARRAKRSCNNRACLWYGRAMNSPPERPAGSVDPKLLEILVCPLTKGPLEYDAARQELISRKAKLAYPIRDGIPIMLAGAARRLEGWDPCPGRGARQPDARRSRDRYGLGF